MKIVEDEIIEILKKSLEYSGNVYRQWIIGISIRSLGKSERERVYRARTVIKTNESPYVDGMDILFKVCEGEVKIDPLYYENTPEYQGGEVADAVRWLESNGEIAYKCLGDLYVPKSEEGEKR